MDTLTYFERILQTYSLEEIFDLNGLTEDEVLKYLVQHNFLELPDPKPVDLLDD